MLLGLADGTATSTSVIKKIKFVLVHYFNAVVLQFRQYNRTFCFLLQEMFLQDI